MPEEIKKPRVFGLTTSMSPSRLAEMSKRVNTLLTKKKPPPEEPRKDKEPLKDIGYAFNIDPTTEVEFEITCKIGRLRIAIEYDETDKQPYKSRFVNSRGKFWRRDSARGLEKTLSPIINKITSGDPELVKKVSPANLQKFEEARIAGKIAKAP